MIDISFDELPQRRLKPANERKRRNPGKFDRAQFIAWDGEGVTNPDGTHHYVLFANSLGHSVNVTANENGTITKGIHTSKALTLLIETARDNPHAIHVVFFGGYDFNLILRDVPRDILERLRRGKRSFYSKFNLQVRFGKSLWVKDRDTGVSVTLWDVGPFFQQSFVKALKTWSVVLPPGVLSNIEAQKANRASFSFDNFEAIREYCFQELDSLVLLMQDFRNALEACNLRIQQWHGPGAIAAKLYSQHSIKDHKRECPENVNRAAQYAYGGGRIELIRQGHYTGNVYNYDIRSCYPAAISRLPSLSRASWQHIRSSTELYATSGRTGSSREFSLYKVDWCFRTESRFYPVRYRHTSGNVCYPPVGRGAWLWTPEYDLLCDFFPGEFEVTEAFMFEDTDPVRPFTWVEDMYNERMKWKAQGYGAERILKLGLNSLYGKMIQQLGWSDGKLPAWHQLEWGGYVTSSARASIFRAAYGCSGVIGFETDGILSTEPLHVPLSEQLGGWELSTHNSITYVQTGFYWLDDKVRYRGFDPGTVSRQQVLDGWARNDPTISAQLTRLIGLNYAAHNDRWDLWGNWVTSPRELHIGSASNKRILDCGSNCRGCTRSPYLSDVLHDTRPYPELVTEPSAPYPLAWKPEGLPEWKIQALADDMELGDFDVARWS